MKDKNPNETFFRQLLIMGSWCVLLYLAWILGKSYKMWLRESKTFSIKQIEVSGNDLLSKKETLQLGGLSPKASIWQVDLKKAKKKVSSNPFVDEIHIERSFPDVLRIVVKEKHPIALLNFEGKFFCIDKEGLVFPSPRGKLYDLPVLSGGFYGGAVVGKKVGGKLVRQGLDFLVSVLEKRPELYSQISEVAVGRPKGLVVYTNKGGIPVLVGEGEYERKICYLEAILEKLIQSRDFQRVQYIDLRFRDQVVVGMRA